VRKVFRANYVSANFEILHFYVSTNCSITFPQFTCRLILYKNEIWKYFCVKYKDKSSEIGKWLTHFFGLTFLPTNDIEDCFVDFDGRCTAKCSRFADYILENYVTVNSKFPTIIWAAPPDPDTKRTTNGPESFHSHLNAQFYAVATRKNEKERLDFAIETYEKFVAGELSKNEFVKTVGYKYSARTDIWFFIV
jgi:hypothetical protein